MLVLTWKTEGNPKITQVEMENGLQTNLTIPVNKQVLVEVPEGKQSLLSASAMKLNVQVKTTAKIWRDKSDIFESGNQH